jgi:hypothetical protein
MDNLISIIEMLEVATGRKMAQPMQEVIDYIEERASMKAKVSDLNPEYAATWLASEEGKQCILRYRPSPPGHPDKEEIFFMFILLLALKFTKDYTMECTHVEAEKTIHPFAAGVSDFYKIGVEFSRRISKIRHFRSLESPGESEFFRIAHELGFQPSHTKALKYKHFKRWTLTLEGESYLKSGRGVYDDSAHTPYMEFLVIMAHVFDRDRRGFHIPTPRYLERPPDSTEKVRAQQQVTQKFLGKKRSMNGESHDPECDYYLKEVLKQKQFLENHYPCPLRTSLKDRMSPPTLVESGLTYAQILKNWWNWCCVVVFGVQNLSPPVVVVKPPCGRCDMFRKGA